jgi:uncharacterized protein involved in exopolysaccharide biosynthesis
VSTNPSAFDDAPLLDLRAIFDKLLAARWWLVASVIVGAMAFGIVAFMMKPIYRGTVVLVPVTSMRGAEGLGAALGQLDGLASIVGMGLGGRGADTAEAIAVLRSREFTERFITDHALVPRLFPEKWDAANKKWTVDKGKEPTLAKAFKLFDKKYRTVNQDRKTGLVTVTVDWTNPADAAAWANELAQRLNREMRARAIANADASVQFLEKELMTTTTIATRDAISRLVEAQVKQRMLANVTEEYAFRIVDRALPVDKDDVVRPRRFRLILTGAAVGFLLGAIGILLSGSLRAPKP